MSQLDLFGQPIAAPAAKERPAPSRKPTIEERFEAFHKANPEVMHELMRLARARVARGERRVGVKALWEELRVACDRMWEGGLGGPDGKYKLDNSFTALYARALIERAPELEDVIEIRRRKAK